MPFDPQTQLILIYVGLFLLLWISICWIISRLGWKQLTHRYTAHSPPKGARFSFQSATIGRFGKYNHCLTIHVCKVGESVHQEIQYYQTGGT